VTRDPQAAAPGFEAWSSALQPLEDRPGVTRDPQAAASGFEAWKGALKRLYGEVNYSLYIRARLASNTPSRPVSLAGSNEAIPVLLGRLYHPL
jgi:hypothetical protein